jgi:deoxycytidylate deaminase
MNIKIFSTLEELAILSIYKHKLAAAIVKKNKIVAVGLNSFDKSHPFQKKWGKNSDAIFLHAEISAIIQALKIMDDLSNCDLYICRMKKNEKKEFAYGMSKPCEGCNKAIAAFNIKNVFYTTDTKNVVEIL